MTEGLSSSRKFEPKALEPDKGATKAFFFFFLNGGVNLTSVGGFY